jgi:hypothetical protein
LATSFARSNCPLPRPKTIPSWLAGTPGSIGPGQRTLSFCGSTTLASPIRTTPTETARHKSSAASAASLAAGLSSVASLQAPHRCSGQISSSPTEGACRFPAGFKPLRGRKTLQRCARVSVESSLFERQPHDSGRMTFSGPFSSTVLNTRRHSSPPGGVRPRGLLSHRGLCPLPPRLGSGAGRRRCPAPSPRRAWRGRRPGRARG